MNLCYTNNIHVIRKMEVVTFFEATISEEIMDKCCTCGKCSVAIKDTLSILGSKWTFLILWNLYDNTKRFSQLQRSLQGISPKTLSLRLHELENNGVISKTVYPEVPPRVEYSITNKGSNLRTIFVELIKWSNNCEK